MQKFYMFFKCSLVLMLVFLANAAFAQITVTGTVTDDVGPLPNVSVRIVGKSAGTQTNASGKFTIGAAQGDVLRFSAVGFAARQVTVGSETTINVKLTEDNSQLNEVVVTAFGIKREAKALGYASSTVSAKELTEAGNTNLASALYGKAAGVKINTSPGGASSAVNVQIRGINSINYNSQPLYVVDGVILRNNGQNGAGGANNGGFYDDQRIRGNGILDVNPEDIESLTVLKGASATALYGSDATSGVIVITTKKGIKGKGLGIDFNYYGTIENAAFLPDYQNVYGQGYDRATNLSVGAQEDGSFADAASPAGFRPNFRAYNNFGPKMEGQMVRWWDGSIRAYSPQPDNYKNIFRQGYSGLANVSISSQSDKVDYRLSASRLDYNGIQRESNQKKNTFAFNSTVKISPKVSIDLIANYVNTITHNRPYLTNRLAASYDGFFGREEDTNLILEKFQTSQGYKWVPFNQTNRNPAEAFVFNVRPNLYDYFWSTQKNTYDENENRLYTSASLNWDVVKNLKFRGRIGNDYTGKNIEDRQYNEYPVAFNAGTSTGAYSVSKGIYSIVYADALLTYGNKIAKDLNFTASGGITTRRERYNDQSSGTSNGLVIENFFSLSNSTGILSTSSTRQELTKYGYFGILNFNYKDYLFLEGTARQEASSTLPSENNTYFYPSVNAGFVWSDAFKSSMPSFLSFGKLRGSYGVVGNPAPMYQSNILYTLQSLQTVNGSVPQSQIASAYGNSTLKPEKKYEKEIGIETRMFNNRFGFDLTYYDNKIKNIILNLPVAPSVGAASQIVNVGEIGNKGWELAMNGTPLTGAFKWDVRANVALNTTKAYSLGNGITEIGVYSAESNAIKVVIAPGEKLGTIFVNPLQTDASGRNVISSDGFHVIDQTRYVKAGNVQPGVTGGVANTFSYKAFSLNVMVDYRFGGQLVSSPQKYALGAGMYKSTLKYRDTENGGLTYYVNPAGTYVQIPVTQTAGPNGEKVYHDGLILPGVYANGQPNTTIIDAANYYENEFAASGDSNNQEGAIYDNSFIKLREVTLGYTLPNTISKKLGMTNLRISLIGRNLMYFWKTLKNLDPETVVGNQWYRQGVDEGSLPATRSYGFSINAKF
ncbi:MAG: SusC/RagA family TonB-linked outer membrane protein [Pedobacter sp.]|uniref:SusC/RagA family TonB-linked outer membrane protein n=1 Tax=Pedobacter sp. TaxID=1411316 RepID=UPI003395AFE8